MIFHFSVTLRLSKFTEKDYDENLIYLLGQYLPQSDGGVRDEGLGEEDRACFTVSYRIGGDQPGGDRQPGLSTGTAQARRARHFLRGTRCAPASTF